MKTRIHSLFLLAVLLLGTVKLAQATRIPEVFAGTITQMSKKLMTIKGPEGSRHFDISKAGVCGWPTKKTCSEVFKVGDKVEASYFGDSSSKQVCRGTCLLRPNASGGRNCSPPSSTDHIASC
jgi:hypothetical protein